MEKYDILLFYIFPITSLFATVGLVFLAYKWIRPKFSVLVNCWFCQQKCRVKYDQENSWECSTCQQYNGFNEEGDYNCYIPAQYDSSYSPSNPYCTSSVDYKEATNGLCQSCNRNQVLKVKQLAQFESQNENCFEEEIEDYQQYLETIYRLCSPCEVVVQKTLSDINRFTRKDVLNWRMKQKNQYLRQKSNRKKVWFIIELLLRSCSVTIGFFLLVRSVYVYGLLDFELNSSFLWLTPVFQMLDEFGSYFCIPVICFFMIIVAIVIAGKDRLMLVDATVCFSWLLTVLLDLPFTDDVISSSGLREKAKIMLSSLVFITSAFALRRHRSSPFGQRQTWPSKRLNVKLKLDAKDGGKFLNGEISKPSDRDWCQLQDNCITTTQAYNSKEYSLNSNLSTMSIGTPKKLRKSSVFTVKNYGNSDSFYKLSSSLPVRRSILSPPRFLSHIVAVENRNPLWGSSGNFNLRQPFVYGQFSCGYYRPFSTSSCPVSRCGSVAGSDRLSIFSEPPTISWNSFVKPEMTSFRRNSSSRSVSSSGSSNSSVCEFQTSTPLRSDSQKIETKSSREGQPLWLWLTWMVMGLSLIGNASLFILFMTNWSFKSVIQ